MDRTLETPRLVLRPLTLSDVGALHALVIDPDVRRFMCDGLVFPEARVRRAILDSIHGFRWRGFGFFALRAKDDGAFVGYAGLKPARGGAVELGAALSPRYWRGGLAAEACGAILGDAFGRLGVPRVVACTDAPNLRSLALIARLGFRPLGTTPGVFGAIRWFARDRETR
jgi:RimJ/RimL family protein N-acetyltransferase